MFQVPASIRIVAFPYECVTVHEDVPYEGKSHGTDGYIRIVESLTNQKKASTLLHEIMHCILHEYNVVLAEEDEERVILALESGFVCLATDEQSLYQKMVKAMRLPDGRKKRV